MVIDGARGSRARQVRPRTETIVKQFGSCSDVFYIHTGSNAGQRPLRSLPALKSCDFKVMSFHAIQIRNVF